MTMTAEIPQLGLNMENSLRVIVVEIYFREMAQRETLQQDKQYNRINNTTG